MSNEAEQARNSVDAKLKNIGYEHPENNNTSYSPYKAYSESGDVYVSQQGTIYSTFEEKITQKNTRPANICPVCEGKAAYVCPCKVGEKMCKNNHMWYFTKDGNVVVGDPHETSLEKNT
jgi:hypothetical protein